jgi:hypothetical protein
MEVGPAALAISAAAQGVHRHCEIPAVFRGRGNLISLPREGQITSAVIASQCRAASPAKDLPHPKTSRGFRTRGRLKSDSCAA